MAKPWLGNRWWRWVQAIGGLAVIGFVTRYLIRNWQTIRSEPVAWHVSVGWIALSLVIVVATYTVLAESWRRMLAGWGPRLGWLEAARIWVISSMGKYLPGKVWAVAGMALLAERRGIPAGTATASAVLLQIVSIATGGLIVATTGIAVLESHRPGSTVALGVVLAGSLAGLAVMVWPPVARRLLGWITGGKTQRVTPRPAALGFGIAANLAAWVGYGVALWCLARGILPAAALPLPDAVGAFTGSYLAGFLFLLAPGGLGVREGVFMWMLQDRIGPANALVLAAVSRIGMTVADLLAVLPFVLTHPDRTSDPA